MTAERKTVILRIQTTNMTCKNKQQSGILMQDSTLQQGYFTHSHSKKKKKKLT